MLVTPLGVQLFFKKVSHKAPPTFEEGGAFGMSKTPFLKMKARFFAFDCKVLAV
jgi:hypothetical protein